MPTLTPSCRFCGATLKIALPDDPRMREMVTKLSTRACCNRCADYKRRMRDYADFLQVTALLLLSGESNRATIGDAIKRTCEAVVQLGESFYLISGLAKDVPDFVRNVMDDPRGARMCVEYFDRNMHKLAIETRCGEGKEYSF